MVYRGGTDPGSSGGLILKVAHRNMVMVGLHCGGCKLNWDGQGAQGYNYGSCFTEIKESIDKKWQQPHPLGNYIP